MHSKGDRRVCRYFAPTTRHILQHIFWLLRGLCFHRNNPIFIPCTGQSEQNHVVYNETRTFIWNKNTYMYFSFWEKQIINRKENTERYNLIGIMLFLDIGQMLWHHHWRQLEKFGCFDFREVRTDWCTGKAGIPNTWVGILNAVPSTDMM